MTVQQTAHSVLSSYNAGSVYETLRAVLQVVEDKVEFVNQVITEIKKDPKCAGSWRIQYVKKALQSYGLGIEIGQGASVCGWSDSRAYTVIKVSRNGKKITLQRAIATKSKDFIPEWIEGGFAGHCVNNNEQTYTYEANPKGNIVHAYLRKNGRFYVDGCSLVNLDGYNEFYDYNF